MSRSHKKVVGGGITTAPSDKEFKVLEHRRFRRIIKSLIDNGEEEFFPDYRGKFGDPWCSPKDGHRVEYWSMHSFLQTMIVTQTRTGSFYIPWWRKSGGPIRRLEFHERPATSGDWKKYISK